VAAVGADGGHGGAFRCRGEVLTTGCVSEGQFTCLQYTLLCYSGGMLVCCPFMMTVVSTTCDRYLEDLSW